MKAIDFKIKKQQGSKICLLTCYDYPSAQILSESAIDAVLVGDSVAMAVHGFDTTIRATMDMMVLHTEAVARGLKKKFLIEDLPFMGHRISQADTVANIKRLMQAGAQAIKIEGGDPHSCEVISFLVQSGVPVLGHIGLTAQTVHQLGGYRVQGRDQKQALELMKQARDLESAGCVALVIECVPQNLAKAITASLSIPTIGIGAGVDTDGQILVWHDLLGLQNEFKPKFLKQYLQGKEALLSAINCYAQQVHHAEFPSPEYAFED